jgi:hypothetical protein
MKLLFAPIVIGTLALTSASPAVAQSKPADKATSVGLSTTRDPTAERNSDTQQAQEEVRVWEKRLRDFEAKAQVKVTAAETSASKELNDAWTETKSASSQLETAAEADWNGAKDSFKKATDKLVVAWNKVNPADK